MNLQLQNQLFLIGGAGSGFGRAVAEALMAEGASIIAVARGFEKLEELKLKFDGKVETVAADITELPTITLIMNKIGERQLHGVLINAGGPPAMTVLESTLEDWDNAYRTVLRWKIALMQSLLPKMIERRYGRIVFIESASVKQPMENLVLSNSLRLAVVGYANTLSREIGKYGITLNILAPGYHATAAMERIIIKKFKQSGVSREEAIREIINDTKVGLIGDPEDLASLAVWFLSPGSRYLTGQTISVDGGTIKGVMG